LVTSNTTLPLGAAAALTSQASSVLRTLTLPLAESVSFLVQAAPTRRRPASATMGVGERMVAFQRAA
jgi:hypothetical protein